MIVGDPTVFAIESAISIAYKELGARALGFFVIHIGGHCYGVREPDATWLANSFDEVERRYAGRKSHTAPFATEPDAGKIVDAFRDAIHAPEKEDYDFFGIPHGEFSKYFCLDGPVWAPDGDEAFDDGSYVLHFDVENRVRLIGFRSCTENYHHDPATLRDVWLEADNFYSTLKRWRDTFEAEWLAAPKLFKAYEHSQQQLQEVARLSKLTESIRQARGGARN